SVFCDGAVSAATETAPSTVMLWANSPTFKERLTVAVSFAATLTPLRRLDAKLGAEASTVYGPAGSPASENLPSWAATTARGAPVDSFFTDTTAAGIGFPETSRTDPAIEPLSAPDWASAATAVKSRGKNRARAHVICIV